MEIVYKKLLENLSKMTPEQKSKEWESLKRFNDIGPDIEEYLIMVKGIMMNETLITIDVSSEKSLYSDSCFYLAA